MTGLQELMLSQDEGAKHPMTISTLPETRPHWAQNVPPVHSSPQAPQFESLDGVSHPEMSSQSSRQAPSQTGCGSMMPPVAVCPPVLAPPDATIGLCPPVDGVAVIPPVDGSPPDSWATTPAAPAVEYAPPPPALQADASSVDEDGVLEQDAQNASTNVASFILTE